MKTRRIWIFAGLVGTALVVGCADQNKTASSDKASPATAPVMASSAGAGGAQLWADNCSRCHNIRPPQSYSDTQWEAVVMHMRLRANLTGTEQREITRFLQASH